MAGFRRAVNLTLMDRVAAGVVQSLFARSESL